MSSNFRDQMEDVSLGPDSFGFYANMLAELLSRDDDLVPFPHQTSALNGNLHEMGRVNNSTENSRGTKDTNCINGSAVLFSNGIGAQLSDFKIESLRSLLRESVFTLTKEVDEMVKPVLSVCRIRACLEHKASLLSLDTQPPPNKKLKGLLPFSDPESERVNQPKNGSTGKSDVGIGIENVVINDDLRIMLENSTRVKELMGKHTSEFSATLDHMEKKLEELLNTVMTSCRPMTATEKQYLRKWIQKLPPKNLDRAVEIIGRDKPAEKFSGDRVQLDLDEEDNVTLWRLYFYVRAVKGSRL